LGMHGAHHGALHRDRGDILRIRQHVSALLLATEAHALDLTARDDAARAAKADHEAIEAAPVELLARLVIVGLPAPHEQPAARTDVAGARRDLAGAVRARGRELEAMARPAPHGLV